MKKTTLAVFLSLAIAGPALALSAGPLAKIYTANEKVGELDITNTSASVETYQISVVYLKAENGKVKEYKTVRPDGIITYDETDKIKFKPSMVTLPAGKTQKIRFLRTNDEAGEQFYRVIVHQLPDPTLKTFQKLKAMDFPWVWRPDGLAPNLSARWEGQALVVTNTGTASAQLAELVAGAKSKNGLVGYVLAGETRAFTLKDFPHVNVSVKVNGKTVELAAK